MSGPSSEGATAQLARPIPLEGVHPVADWAWAQARTNFVLVGPRAGSPWRIAEPTIRGESAKAHSTLRFFLESAGRRLRVKQYYHDWWIPTVADISFRRPGRPLAVGDQVAFVGRDYRRHEASCGHAWGTGVEFSLESGALDDAGWTALWQDVDALAPAAVRQARGSCFAARNYWNRWNRTEAPWDTREISSLRWSAPTTETMEEAAWALTADRWAVVPGVIDSIGFAPSEVQFVFSRPVDLNVSAWMRVLRDAPAAWRPLIDHSEVNRPAWERIEIAGVAVERAAADEQVGNWYFAWRSGEAACELHLRARRGLDRASATRCIQALVR